MALVRLISLLEAGIDFAEDDVSVLSFCRNKGSPEHLIHGLNQLYNSYSHGRIVSAGLSLAIVRRPNVGKSSLFNALLKEDRAIVTEIPGTTRDLITESIEIRGIPFRLLDTAGIRKVSDQVERIGIDKSLEALADADRVLAGLRRVRGVYRTGPSPPDACLRTHHYTVVINKSDLPQRLNLDGLLTDLKICSVSAKTGAGVELLKETLVERSIEKECSKVKKVLLPTFRHAGLLGQAMEALTRVQQSVESQLPHEILLLDCYAGLKVT